METLLVRLLIAAIGLIVSARAHLTMTVGGLPVQVPVLLLVAVIMILALAALVLWIVRVLVRDGLRVRPRVVAL